MRDREKQRQNQRRYNQKPKTKERRKQYDQRPEVRERRRRQERQRRQKSEVKEKLKQYFQRPDIKERERLRLQKPEVKERRKQQRRQNRQKPENKKRERISRRMYYQSPKGKIAMTERNTKRRQGFDFIPLNTPFPHSVGHHIDSEYVIYIPKEIHAKFPHRLNDIESMYIINPLAFQFLYPDEPAQYPLGVWK